MKKVKVHKFKPNRSICHSLGLKGASKNKVNKIQFKSLTVCRWLIKNQKLWWGKMLYICTFVFFFLSVVSRWVISPSSLSTRQLWVSGFTLRRKTIECGTKRETATHFAPLVASRCYTPTLTFGSRQQHLKHKHAICPKRSLDAKREKKKSRKHDLLWVGGKAGEMFVGISTNIRLHPLNRLTSQFWWLIRIRPKVGYEPGLLIL